MTNKTQTPARDPRTFSGRTPTDPDRSRANLLQALTDLGARTSDCDHGYTFADTCPVCD